MDFEKRISDILEKHGQNILVNADGSETPAKAFIQPLRYKNKMYLELERSEIGIKDNTCFLYIGPASCDFSKAENVMIASNDCIYTVSRADVIMLGNAPIYIWAVLNKHIKDGEYDFMQ